MSVMKKKARSIPLSCMLITTIGRNHTKVVMLERVMMIALVQARYTNK